MEKIFESEKILFCKMTESLTEKCFKMYSDPKIQLTLFKKIYSDDQILNWIQTIINKDNVYIMIEKQTNNFIGSIEMIVKDNNIGEIMITITPEQQGKHYSTEAIESLINYYKNKFDLIEYELYVKKNNTRAIHCYERVGFKESGEGLTDDNIHMKLIK